MFTGFRGAHRDVQPAVVTHKDLVEDEGDPNPCPEDDADFMRPDAEQMEEAIGNFMDDMEKQEQGGFTHLHTLLSKMPVPVYTECRAMSHETALESGFLPDMSEEDRKRFTPSELMLYKHALEYKWTAEELRKVIAMLRNPEFDSKEVDPDLYKRMNKAVQDGRIM